MNKCCCLNQDCLGLQGTDTKIWWPEPKGSSWDVIRITRNVKRFFKSDALRRTETRVFLGGLVFKPRHLLQHGELALEKYLLHSIMAINTQVLSWLSNFYLDLTSLLNSRPMNLTASLMMPIFGYLIDISKLIFPSTVSYTCPHKWVLYQWISSE